MLFLPLDFWRHLLLKGFPALILVTIIIYTLLNHDGRFAFNLDTIIMSGSQ